MTVTLLVIDKTDEKFTNDAYDDREVCHILTIIYQLLLAYRHTASGRNERIKPNQTF